MNLRHFLCLLASSESETLLSAEWGQRSQATSSQFQSSVSHGKIFEMPADKESDEDSILQLISSETWFHFQASKLIDHNNAVA